MKASKNDTKNVAKAAPMEVEGQGPEIAGGGGIIEVVGPTLKASQYGHDFNPHTNPKAISLIEQPDGNWMGWMTKFGKIVEAREGKPEDVLTKLVTHV